MAAKERIEVFRLGFTAAGELLGALGSELRCGSVRYSLYFYILPFMAKFSRTDFVLF